MEQVALRRFRRCAGKTGRQRKRAVPEHPELRAPWSRSERRIPRTVVRPLQQFLNASTSSGYVLIVAVAVALVWANSPWSAGYERLWTTPLVLRIGDTAIGTD